MGHRQAFGITILMDADSMIRFENQNLTDFELRECDFTRSGLTGVVMRDAFIDGLVTNLTINGVEVSSLSSRPSSTGDIRCDCSSERPIRWNAARLP